MSGVSYFSGGALLSGDFHRFSSWVFFAFQVNLTLGAASYLSVSK